MNSKSTNSPNGRVTDSKFGVKHPIVFIVIKYYTFIVFVVICIFKNKDTCEHGPNRACEPDN